MQRRAVEALLRTIRDNRPPDYTQDLAVLGRGLDEIGSQLETIQKSPALNMTPEQQGQPIANAGSAIFRGAAQKLDRAAQEADRERYNLSQMIGTLGVKEQRRRFGQSCCRWCSCWASSCFRLRSAPCPVVSNAR